MLSFKFKGSVADLQTILHGVNKDSIVECFSVDVIEKEVTETIEDKAWRLCRPIVVSGNKIKAIKNWREVTGVSLEEAKDEVESRGSAEGLYVMGKDGWLVSKQ